MSTGGGELVVRALEDEGVVFCFGIPGTHNIELYDAMAESSRVRPILVTDEQSASFMADAVWRASGRLACVNVVPGAGLTHALSGIAEAFLDNVPLLVLGCGIRRDTGHAFQLHDVDQRAIAAPVTKATFLPERGEELYATVRRACRLARSGTPGPVMVEVPANLYMSRHEAALVFDEPEPVVPAADGDTLERAAALLASARRPLLYVGLGAAGADLVGLAEALESPVSSTFQGKGVFPESHPLFLWPGFGTAAPGFARRIAAECDATVAIGCRFGEVGTGSYGLTPPQPLVHVDIDAGVLGRNYPTALGVNADAGGFVSALLPRLTRRSEDPGLRARIVEGRRQAREEARRGGGDGVDPALLLERLQAQLGAEAIYTSDSGNGTFLAVELLQLDAPGQLLAPVDYSCMGYAVPAALGAKLARPERPVVALAGDGALLMTGLEMLTAAHLSLPVLIVVLRDRELAQIAQFQGVALNRRVCSALPDYDLASLSRSLGVEPARLDADDQVDAALSGAREILEQGRPALLDVRVDYSRKTHFTRGVVKTNLNRFSWPERLRLLGRALARRVTG